MPRQRRLDLPSIPHHVIQRGNDRKPCFFCDADRRRYLASMREAARKYDCAVHAYVLMTNHVHLLVTPARAGAISRMMQHLGRAYVSYVNATRGRTGTLWEGRFRSCLVDSDVYLLTCQRYIELNPVRATIVAHPGDYPWSSYHRNAHNREDALVAPHPVYLSLGPTPATRADAYADIVRAGSSAYELTEIRTHIQQQRAMGSEHFRSAIQARLGLCAGVRPARRPSKGEVAFKRA